MSNYTPQVTWSGKDSLSSSDPEKIISGADFNTEVLAIQTAINSKMDTTSGTTTGQTLINPVLNTSVSGTAVKDEDDMSSNSATHIATQQSIKAYVDAGTITFTNKTLTAPTINGAVGGTTTSQTITTLTTTNVDGILGANTPAAVSGTTGSFSGNVTASTAPSNAAHLTNKTYVDALFSGMAQRSTVRAATTANITISTALNNGDTLDGVTLATNDLVLVKNQTDAEDNGIYVVQASPARDDLFDTYDEHPGALIAVTEGSTNADTIYLCTSNKGGTLDTTDLVWTKVQPSATSLSGLTDTTISSPTSGQALVYSGSTWEAGSAGVGVGLTIALS